MASRLAFPILDLPEELIVLIVEHVNDRKTLRSLACTCRQLQSLAESGLYRSLLTRSILSTGSIKAALEQRPQRFKALQTLHVPCEHSQLPCSEGVAAITRRARNLKELTFESPECNTGRFEDEDDWDIMADPLLELFEDASSSNFWEKPIPEQPLQRLQKLTLHINGTNSPYWAIDSRSIHIFTLPALRELKISCVNIDDIPITNHPCSYSTPLQHLTLEECNVTHLGLSRLLAIPKELQSLSLGENCHNILHFPHSAIPLGSNHLFERDPRLATEALEQQKHSLTSLTYITTPMYAGLAELFNFSYSAATSVDGGFSDFHALEKIELRGYCPAFERAVMSIQPPPNLQNLAFKAKKLFRKAQNASLNQDGNTTMSGIPFLRAPSASKPKTLRSLDITYTADHGMMVVDILTAGSRERSFIRDAAKLLREMGVELRVSATRVEGEALYFPPYLYGESEPAEDVVFDDGDFVGPFKASERRLVSRVARTLLGL